MLRNRLGKEGIKTMEMVNGYVFLDLTKSNVYSKALKVLGTDKPVVIKDASGSPYFVDSLTLDGTNVVITKGGKTITIANDNTITSSGDIQVKLYTYQCYITGEGDDSNNHDIRFIIYSDKELNNDNIIDYFVELQSSDDWSFVGYDTESRNIFVILSIDTNSIITRDIANGSDIEFVKNVTTIEIRKLI